MPRSVSATIDISAFAIDLVRDRRLKDPTIPTVGIPADLEGARKLAAEQPFAFESWAVTRLLGFAPNTQQRGDGGIDGRATLALPPDDLDSRLALAQQLRMGDKPASTWLGRVRQHAGENAWLFEPDYLRDDGYVEKKDQNGKPFWSLEEPS